jgi:TonB-linked SusC/RagA family outer membrane protein
MKLTAFTHLFQLRHVAKEPLPGNRNKLTRYILPILLCLFFFPGEIRAEKFYQGIEVKGRVTDLDAKPISGVSVALKGTNEGVATNEKGEFVIKLPSSRGILVFSSVGYKTQELSADAINNMNIIMEAESMSLQEVVAIGYGVAKKKDLTGSISTLAGDEVAKRNTTQLSQALQGTIPGIMVTRNNSQPGASAAIRIRGITTIGESEPLIIVDGVPVSNIDDINADDIEDISVLKDAASASIYGSRAAAGVILVTTKRPKSGQIAFEYNANFGFERATSFPEVVGVRRYLEMINEFTWNDAGNNAGGEYALYTQDEVENWLNYNKTNPDQYPVTNWIDRLMNRSAPRSSHFFGFTVGGEKVKSRASINYEKVGGLYDYRSYERVIARINNTFDFNKYFSANVDLQANYSKAESPVINPVWDAQRFAPIYAATWADGRIAQGQNGSNAYAQLHFGGFSDTWRNKLTGRVSLQFKPTKDLTFTGVVSPNIGDTKAKDFTKKISYYTAEDPTVFGGFIAGHQNTSLSELRSNGKSITKQLLANYIKKLGDHNFNLLAGYEDYYSFNESLTASSSNYVLTNFPYLDLGPLDFMRNSGNAYETSYRSFFGRMMYDYKNKYFLQANIRYDGSSRFHPDYRWGYFPSISAGWTVSEESFMENNKIFSYLKLRGSWGQLGNERIGNYPYQSSIGYSNALFFQGNNVVSSMTAAQFAYAIQDITWEVTETSNIGFDAYFLNNRLMLTGDFYQKKTKDMLLELEIPDYMGFENPQQNTGIMTTKGWDAQLSWRDKIGKLKYSMGVNVSDSRTRMGTLGGIVFDGAQVIREGSEFNEWFGYLSDGLYQTLDDVTKSPKLYAAVKPGDVKYKDISGPDGVPDGKITPDYDRVLLGGSLPRFLYGGNINLEYQGFDFSLAVQGVGKQTARLSQQMVKPFHSAWTNAPAIIDGNYWSPYKTEAQNLSAKYPRLSYTSAENNNYVNSDYWLINGAYFRLKNVTIGYTLPRSIVSRLRMNSIRVHASGTDLFAISNFPKGYDPEAAYNTYISSAFNFGFTVKF